MKFIVFIAVKTLFLLQIKAININIKNSDGGQIWVGIQGNEGHEHLENGGFKLDRYQWKTIQAPFGWSGKFWSRTWCSDEQGCLTGDCGNHVECAGVGGTLATLVELTLGEGGLDYYGISLVNGFNSMAWIQPIDAFYNESDRSCWRASCSNNLFTQCPDELKVLHDKNFQVIGCKSPCLAFGTDEYCCTGDHDQSDTCKSSDWKVNYFAEFKNICHDAHSYVFDNVDTTFYCISSNYEIHFGNDR